MRGLVFTCLALALALAAGALPARAQSCFPRAALIATLQEKYGEELRMQAMTTPGPLIEVLVAPSGSWTAILTRPDGLSCPIASGQGFEMIAPLEGDPA